MLKQRVLTAVVLLVILGATTYSQSYWPFIVFLGVACGCAGWEWSRLTMPQTKALPLVLGFVLFALTMSQAFQWLSQATPVYFWMLLTTAISVCVWLFAIIPTVFRANAQAPATNLWWTLFSPVCLFSTWSVLAYLYIERGALYVLSLLVLIWIADIAAYFAGKAWGKHKLAPSISPGKTKEGALAGIAGVVIWVLCSSYWPSSFGASLVQHWSWIGAILFAVLLGALSIVGDLFESLLKRRAGIKDSSQLLPGHGGVYDRIDAVVAVVPLAFVLSELSLDRMPW